MQTNEIRIENERLRTELLMERSKTQGPLSDANEGSTQLLLKENKQLRDELGESYKKLEIVARELELSLAVRKTVSELEVQLKKPKTQIFTKRTQD